MAQLERRDVILGLIVFLVALAIRIWHITSLGYLDHNGDSYHHWLTSYLTATHGYTHTDYKGATVTIAWLPLYHYMIAVLMNAFRIYTLDVQHGVNIILGSLTCLIVYAFVRNSASTETGFAGGLALAVQPWFVDVSTLGVSEMAAIFPLTFGFYSFVRGRVSLSAVAVALAMLARYEAWVLVLALVIVGLIQKCGNRRQLVVLTVVWTVVVAGWSLNSLIQTGHAISWYTTQAMTVKWDRLFTDNADGALKYFEVLIQVTSGMFLLGLLAGLAKSDRDARLLISLEIIYLLVMVSQFFRGTVPFQVRFLSYLLPLTAALSCRSAGFLSNLSKNLGRKRKLGSLILVVIVVFPLWNQFWIIAPTTDQTRLDRHVAAELIAGQLLGKIYENGSVLCDSPAIIYYSNLDPGRFYSTSNLEWYRQTWNKSEFAVWMKERNVRYLIWQNVSYSASWWLFPELSSGRGLQLTELTFRTVAFISSDYGPIYIYKIENHFR